MNCFQWKEQMFQFQLPDTGKILFTLKQIPEQTLFVLAAKLCQQEHYTYMIGEQDRYLYLQESLTTTTV
jgi:hypothetical protein